MRVCAKYLEFTYKKDVGMCVVFGIYVPKVCVCVHSICSVQSSVHVCSVCIMRLCCTPATQFYEFPPACISMAVNEHQHSSRCTLGCQRKLLCYTENTGADTRASLPLTFIQIFFACMPTKHRAVAGNSHCDIAPP